MLYFKLDLRYESGWTSVSNIKVKGHLSQKLLSGDTDRHRSLFLDRCRSIGKMCEKNILYRKLWLHSDTGVILPSSRWWEVKWIIRSINQSIRGRYRPTRCSIICRRRVTDNDDCFSRREAAIYLTAADVDARIGFTHRTLRGRRCLSTNTATIKDRCRPVHGERGFVALPTLCRWIADQFPVEALAACYTGAPDVMSEILPRGNWCMHIGVEQGTLGRYILWTAPVCIYYSLLAHSEILVENCRFQPTSPVFRAAFGVTTSEFRRESWAGVGCVSLAVLIQYRLVTDGRTGRRTTDTRRQHIPR